MNVKMDKRTLHIVLKNFSEVSTTFSDIKEFMDKKLEETCAKEDLSIQDVIHSLLFCLIDDADLCFLLFCCLPVFNIKNSCF